MFFYGFPDSIRFYQISCISLRILILGGDTFENFFLKIEIFYLATPVSLLL